MQYCTAVRKDVMEKQLHPPDVPGPGEYEVESWRKPIRSQLKNAQVSSIGKSQRPPLHVGEKDTPACRYDLTPSIGPQTESRCKSALASRFGTSLRPPLEKVSHLAISAVVVISIRLCSRQSNPPPILPRNRILCHS